MDRFVWILCILIALMDVSGFVLALFYPNVYQYGAQEYAWMAFILIYALIGVAYLRPSGNWANAKRKWW